MKNARVSSNPDLTVGADNKQRWNKPSYRRRGFHNAHLLFRRAMMVRSRNVLMLESAPQDLAGRFPELSALIENSAFSAISVLRGGKIIMENAAADFSTTAPQSIQSITKMHIHLIIGRLLEQGLVSLVAKVSDYLPDIGSGYGDARVQALLDMTVTNEFSEEYSDPNSDCFCEEIALGWRLPEEGAEEVTLKEFAGSITGFVSDTSRDKAQYKSANTDVSTLIAAAVSPVPLPVLVEEITDAVGYEGTQHISVSKDGLPAFSGGGCLSARDLARFGLLFARGGRDLFGRQLANAGFMTDSLVRIAPTMASPKDRIRYSNHFVTDGRFIGHEGYRGQFLLVDTKTGTSCAFFSVLQKATGYNNYTAIVASVLRKICYAEP